MQPIHLSYTPDRADFLALSATEPTPRVLRMAFIGSVVAMSAGLGWLSENVPLFAALTAWSPPWGEVAVVTAMVVAMFGVLMVLRRLSREVGSRRAAAKAGPVTVDVDDDGVTVTGAERPDVYPWAEVRATRLGRGHVFIAVPGDRRIAAPRRAFADTAAMLAFALAAEERVRIESDREDGIEPAATAEAAP
jgi:hypothetical protein